MSELQFESQKNLKAFLYTAALVTALLLLFILWRWPLNTWSPQAQEEYIAVNLGNSDEGIGEDQPFQPGEPTVSEATAQPAQNQPITETTPDVVTDEKDPDAPTIKEPPKTAPKENKFTEQKPEKNVVTKQSEEDKPVAPKTQTPKALYKGATGTGPGGNDADNFKKGTGEGIKGGTEDQGKPGGDPDATNYIGGGRGNSGLSVQGLQGRRIKKYPTYSDDFKNNAKVAIDVKVDESGAVIEATYNPRGSSGTADVAMRAMALRKAKEIKFTKGDIESIGTLIFNFTVK